MISTTFKLTFKLHTCFTKHAFDTCIMFLTVESSIRVAHCVYGRLLASIVRRYMKPAVRTSRQNSLNQITRRMKFQSSMNERRLFTICVAFVCMCVGVYYVYMCLCICVCTRYSL